MNNNLVVATLLFSFTQAIIWFQVNGQFLSSFMKEHPFIVSLFVAIPILTVFSSYFSSTSEYMELLKTTFLKDYIINSAIILFGVLFACSSNS